MPELPKEYKLVIAEKPDAARRIAAALARNSSGVEDHTEYLVCKGATNYVIVPAVGHLFAMTSSYTKRDIYPVLDLCWVPLSAVDKKRKDVDRRIGAFRSLSRNASEFIIACDYDTEGDTIGYNILKYACGLKKVKARRAKFSTLTEEELLNSLSGATWQETWPMAEAGRIRHFLDFAWGINLSRALVDSLLEAGGKYVTLSIGRVQGPTLNYIHEREVNIRSFVPSPYWQAKATAKWRHTEFSADYTVGRIHVENEAMAVKSEVEGRKGVVVEASRKRITIPPSPPFNLGDLQHEAFRIFGLSPSATLSIAEGLYLQAAISYPRTSSQQVPASIGYRHILESLSSQSAFRDGVMSALSGKLDPVQGHKSDPAHPAIYPTGDMPQGLDSRERRVYELIAQRFIAAFCQNQIKEQKLIKLRCGRHEFRASVSSVIIPGWSSTYRFRDLSEVPDLPPVEEGDEVEFTKVDIVGLFESPPSRYNQNTLLDMMEKDNIGTKATRAEIISTLIDRGYVLGDSLELSQLGFAIVETMAAFSPSILSIDLTRAIESELEGVEHAELEPERVAVSGASQLMRSLRYLETSISDVGASIRTANSESSLTKGTLGACPICHEGQLLVIRSRKTGKRFVGCTSYSKGCKASAPLPQRGTVRATRNPCKVCGWPVVLVFTTYGRPPWRLCVNSGCPSKHDQRAVGGR